MIWLLLFLMQGVIIGGVITMVTMTRKARRRRPEMPICGCSHHLSFHGDGGPCNNREGYNNTSQCGCQKYIQRDTTASVALFHKELMD